METDDIGKNPAGAEAKGDQLQLRGITRTLAEEPYRFDFFQAVRLLNISGANRELIGYDAVASRECVRLRSLVSSHFPPSSISSLILDPAGEHVPEMTVAFFGLHGPMAALPSYYNNLVIERCRRKDFTLRDFLDMFNHRTLSLFYRAWGKYRFWLGAERAMREFEKVSSIGGEQLRAFVIDGRPRKDRTGQMLLELAGLGCPTLRYRTRERRELIPRRAVPDELFRFYSGWFSRRHRPSGGLRAIVGEYFQVQTSVEQFVGQWLALDQEDKTRLGAKDENSQLGVTAFAGDRAWNIEAKIRVSLGPMRYDRFCDFLPTGTGYEELSHTICDYVGAQFDFDIELLLMPSDIPKSRLSGPNGQGSRLGWDTWLPRRQAQAEPAKIVFSVVDL